MTDCSELTISDVACTVCGCVCDDLKVRIWNGRIAHVENACPLAEPWFAGIADRHPPAARIHGITVSLEDAIARSADLLRDSRAPLLFGLSRSSTAGQRAAVQLAEQLGANIDTTASVCHGPSIMAIQQVGESTCSLGEVRNRADLVMFWGADPVNSHPRHFERYSVDAPGQFVPRGRPDRKLIVIDSKQTSTSDQADFFLQITAGKDFEAIWGLRHLIRGGQLPPDCDIGLPHDQVQELASLMTSCRYGVVFFGLGLAQTGIGHANVEGLLRLVAELNEYTRFTARRLRIPGDVTGADCVLCWRTGYPFAVNLARGYPRYNPGEYSANDLLERGEVDACLLVGAESTTSLSARAQQRLASIPTVLLDYPHAVPASTPSVHFVTAIYGVHALGTAYRMDEVPIPLKKFLDSEYSTDDEVLARILDRLGSCS